MFLCLSVSLCVSFSLSISLSLSLSHSLCLSLSLSLCLSLSISLSRSVSLSVSLCVFSLSLDQVRTSAKSPAVEEKKELSIYKDDKGVETGSSGLNNKGKKSVSFSPPSSESVSAS